MISSRLKRKPDVPLIGGSSAGAVLGATESGEGFERDQRGAIAMRSIRGFVVVSVLAGLFAGVVLGTNGVSAQTNATRYRWDIFQFVDDAPFMEPFASGEGGVAYAYADDDTYIMLTGSGTFQTDDPTAVTGGGTWTTFPEHGLKPTGEGTYTVTELISFVEAPGPSRPSSRIPSLSAPMRAPGWP